MKQTRRVTTAIRTDLVGGDGSPTAHSSACKRLTTSVPQLLFVSPVCLPCRERVKRCRSKSVRTRRAALLLGTEVAAALFAVLERPNRLPSFGPCVKLDRGGRLRRAGLALESKLVGV